MQYIFFYARDNLLRNAYASMDSADDIRQHMATDNVIIFG